MLVINNIKFAFDETFFYKVNDRIESGSGAFFTLVLLNMVFIPISDDVTNAQPTRVVC